MSKIDALALRGVVVAAVAPGKESLTPDDHGWRRTEPPSSYQNFPWHLIR